MLKKVSDPKGQQDLEESVEALELVCKKARLLSKIEQARRLLLVTPQADRPAIKRQISRYEAEIAAFGDEFNQLMRNLDQAH